ncbi:MAG TPA: hypothetical protein DCZ69_11980, partial [Syntrophobacteraceae bacterium]|nr:hypothetical protein [Syntrophobacteraceae bacterium]
MNKRVVIWIALVAGLVSLPLAVSFAAKCKVPPFLGSSAPPLVELVLERDHRLYYEAYNDASDLNGDDIPDVGYNNSITYFGYYD